MVYVQTAAMILCAYLDKEVPSSWRKFRDIALYWLDKGVDGFRYDMAEMVPVEFWSYLNSAIKTQNPQAFLLAEVYNRDLYRDYIQLGLMDYLYDKVDFYDSLKGIMQGNERAAKLHQVQAGLEDISAHMLHFLENHDEQRIASNAFAGQVGGAAMGKPALVVSALISASPTMLYFGQEVGEDGSEDLGFGDPSRTSIFDYGGVPAHQRWMNDGKFDGGQLSAEEKALRDYYLKVMRISAYHPAMLGAYVPLPVRKESVSILQDDGSVQGADKTDADKILAFVRSSANGKLLVISHFSQTARIGLNLPIVGEAFTNLALPTGLQSGHELLTGKRVEVQVANQQALVSLVLGPMQSVVIQL
jgi:glycosidase